MKREFRKSQKLMGNIFEITVVDVNDTNAFEHIEAAVSEIKRIEKLLTTYRDDSQTSLINKNAGTSNVCPAR